MFPRYRLPAQVACYPLHPLQCYAQDAAPLRGRDLLDQPGLPRLYYGLPGYR